MNTRSTGGTGRHARKHAGMRGNAAATAIICLLVAGLAGTLLTRYLSPVQISVSDAALVATADNLADSYLAMLRQKIRHAGGKEAVIAYFHGRPVKMRMNGQDCMVTGTLINSKNKEESPTFVQNDDNIKLTLSIALPSTDAKGEFSEIRADRVLSIKKDYLLEDKNTFNKPSEFAEKTASAQLRYLLLKQPGGTPSNDISCFDDDWKDTAIFKNTVGKQDMYWSITKNDAGKWEYRSAYLPPDLDQFPRDDTVCVNRLILTDTPNEASTTWRVWWTAESMPYEELPSVPAN